MTPRSTEARKTYMPTQYPNFLKVLSFRPTKSYKKESTFFHKKALSQFLMGLTAIEILHFEQKNSKKSY